MKDDYNKQLGIRLKAIREHRKLTQFEVAELSNGILTKHKLSHYERGSTALPAYIIPTLCKIYDLTPNKLLGWNNEDYNRESEIIEDIKRINDFTSEIAQKYEEEENILIAASGAENFDESEMEKLREDIEMVKNLE